MDDTVSHSSVVATPSGAIDMPVHENPAGESMCGLERSASAEADTMEAAKVKLADSDLAAVLSDIVGAEAICDFSPRELRDCLWRHGCHYVSYASIFFAAAEVLAAHPAADHLEAGREEQGRLVSRRLASLLAAGPWPCVGTSR